MKLKVISFFLCLLLTLQMLPIAQIGMALSQNQWTEELPDSNNEEGDTNSVVNYNHPYLPPANYSCNTSAFCETKALAYIHFSEKIPSNHSTEVVTPPPDNTF